MKLSQLAKVVSGQLIGDDCDIATYSIDSRQLDADALFIPIVGETHNGHDFIYSAIESGAVAVMSHQPIACPVPVLQVQNTMTALYKLGSALRQLYHPKTIAVTGSCGKTSVRAMLESVFGRAGPTLASQSSFNNHIGVPLTLLRLRPEHAFLISEIGTNHPGEIAPLSKAVQPDVSIITNVAPAHLAGFGSVAAVAKEKGEIYQSLSQAGVAIINADDAFADTWRSALDGRRMVTFGLEKSADVTAQSIQFDALGYPTFTLVLPNASLRLTLRCMGKHSVANALAAAAAAVALDVSADVIKAGLEAAAPVARRLIPRRGPLGATIIDDTYNANPRSVEAALDVLSHYDGESIFVLGDVGEMGEDALAWHEHIGQCAKARGVDRLLCFGELSATAAAVFGESATSYTSQAALIADLKTTLKAGDTVLVKGSNAMHMDKVVKALVTEE